LLEYRDQLDLRVQQGLKVLMVLRAQQEHKVLLDYKVLLVQQEPKALLDFRVILDYRDQQELKVLMVLKVELEPRVKLELKGGRALKDQRVLKAARE
jgi:hypothetical protein